MVLKDWGWMGGGKVGEGPKNLGFYFFKILLLSLEPDGTEPVYSAESKQVSAVLLC